MMNDQEHKRNNDKKISGGTQLLSGKQIQSVQRAIDILNCFNLTTTELTLGQISTRLGLNKGTVHGILNTLHMNGYISQNSSGEYLLGAELFNKASLASDTKRSILIDRSHNYMQNLSDYFQGNCTLFRIDELYLQLDSLDRTAQQYLCGSPRQFKHAALLFREWKVGARPSAGTPPQCLSEGCPLPGLYCDNPHHG